jgi:hypothetical protein
MYYSGPEVHYTTLGFDAMILHEFESLSFIKWHL